MKHDFQQSTNALVGGAWMNPVFLPQTPRRSAELRFSAEQRQSNRDAMVRSQERREERERIARELHDTLLQGFLAASLQLSTAVDEMPADSPSKSSLSRILRLIGRVIEEGRVVLHGLRSPLMTCGSLEQALSDMIREFSPGGARFRVVATGKSKALKPAIQEQICMIGREALFNAVRHSEATLIEVDVEYELRKLRVVIRDNGCGMDAQAVEASRDSHWGLVGMQERARSLGARLRILSRRGLGTEVEVSLPVDFATDTGA